MTENSGVAFSVLFSIFSSVYFFNNKYAVIEKEQKEEERRWMGKKTKKKKKMMMMKKKVQIGKDQEKAQSAKDSHSKNPRWEKTKLTIRYLYHENIS